MRRLIPSHYLRVPSCRLLVTLAAFASGPAALAQYGPDPQPGSPSGQAEAGGVTRPAPGMLQVQNDPALDAVLTQWYEQTKQVTKLQGEHHRWIYDETWRVEMRSKGVFYYEAPDKGRIDLEPIDPAKDPVPAAMQASTSQPYELKSDQPEMWICNGKEIMQINNVMKEYERIPLPPNQQGQNIMEGPLPFLFGMPPEKAKQRYRFQLVGQDANQVKLRVYPLRQEDAANWREAYLILTKPNFLPQAVQLVDDPAAPKKRTVYRFDGLEVNKINLRAIFGLNPFAPNLFNYKVVQAGGVVPAPTPQAGNIMQAGVQSAPSVVGVRYDHAQTMLKARGYNPVLKKGPAAPNPEVIYHVKEQFPAPNTPIANGSEVQIVLWDDPAQAAASAAPPR